MKKPSLSLLLSDLLGAARRAAGGMGFDTPQFLIALNIAVMSEFYSLLPKEKKNKKDFSEFLVGQNRIFMAGYDGAFYDLIKELDEKRGQSGFLAD